jgi:peptidoglycan/LPS O-acetylase OafA/YrhL
MTHSLDSEYLARPKYRPDIDGLRGIAVLSVVGFHAFPDWVRGGFIGVDIFFVISGFLISTIIFENLARNSFSFIEFYARRIKRIFPALLLLLIASYAMGWFVLLPDEYQQLGRHIAGGAGFVSNYVLWNESGYFDSAAETKPLLHLWSLGIEEQFYILWPLLLWCAWKMRLSLLAVTLTLALFSFALNIWQVESDPVATFYLPQTRVWELLAGSVLAYVTLRKPKLLASYGDRYGDIQSLVGAAFIAFGAVFLVQGGAFPGWWALLPTLGAVLVISAGTNACLNRTVLSKRMLVWFGLVSFPLYLWHWPLLAFLRIENNFASHGNRIAAVLIAILLAWLTYRLVETPIRLGRGSKTKAIALVASMTVAGLVGYNCYQREGYYSRFPEIVQQLARYKYDYGKEVTTGACFLSPEQDHSAFSTCTPRLEEKPQTSLLLWGDSHAAHLYPGYKSSFGGVLTIIPRTASSCPPILDMDVANNAHCRKINEYIFSSIEKAKPRKIVLAAVWTEYDWKKIESTITRLRKAGISDVDLVGPVPRWISSLPRQLYLQLKADPLHRVPNRMKSGLNENFLQLDSILADFSSKIGVNYVSPTRILCNEYGCLTMLGDAADTLIARDYGHLTEIGSRFLVSQFPRYIDPLRDRH